MNKIKLFAVFVFANVFSISLSSQTFHDIFGVNGLLRYDEARCAKQTSDGGFIMIGSELNQINGYGDILLVKTNGAGDTTWTYTYGGSHDDIGMYVQQTSDGGYILAGSTNCSGNGSYDVYLIKTNSSGDTLWTRTYGSGVVDYGFTVQQTNDGGYMVFGRSDGYNPGPSGKDYMIKTDNLGIVQWTKTYGSVHGDLPFACIQTSDNGYIMQSDVYSLVSSTWDILLVRTDVNGDTLWTRLYASPVEDRSVGVVQTPDGNFVFGASTIAQASGSIDYMLVKINSSGDTLWTRTYGGTLADTPYSVQLTSDGGCIMAGESWSFSQYNSVYLVKSDANGELLWSTSMSGSAYRYGIFASQNNDGSYIVAGTTSDWGTATGDYDAYLIRTDATGHGYCADADPATQTGHAPISAIHVPIYVGSGAVQGSTPEPFYRNTMFQQVCASPLAIESKSATEFSLSPNPSDGKFHLVADHVISNCSVQLYNALGEKLNEEKKTDFVSGDFDFSGIDAGIYFIKISDGEKTSTVKLILQ
jgi:hypothetical protein